MDATELSDALPTTWWHRLSDGRIECDLCPRAYRLAEGRAGLCFVRACRGDAIALTTYGLSSGFCVDPIEKKPLNHFLPGSAVLSFGTAGCNLACRFCQNWDISKSPEVDTLADAASPTGRCSNRPLTPPATLRRARQIALANGLRYVYTGNVLDRETGSTWGHACGALLIERSGYDLGAWHLTADGRCAGCSQPCAGVFDVRPAHWGSRRVPVRIAIVR